MFAAIQNGPIVGHSAQVWAVWAATQHGKRQIIPDRLVFLQNDSAGRDVILTIVKHFCITSNGLPTPSRVAIYTDIALTWAASSEQKHNENTQNHATTVASSG